jgi:hypothetical protein
MMWLTCDETLHRVRGFTTTALKPAGHRAHEKDDCRYNQDFFIACLGPY